MNDAPYPPKVHRFTSLRARLLLLVLLAMLPLVALIVHEAARDREAALATAKTDSQSLIQLAAEDLESRIAEARHVLHAAAEVAAVRSATAPACGDLLAGILKQAQRYNNLIVVGADGKLLCSALQAGRPVNYADTDYVRRVIESRRPAVGKPTIARITGRAVLPVAWPIAEADGRVGKVFAVGLRLDWFGERYARAGFLPRREMLIWDAEGRLLYRYPDAEKLTGTLHAGAPLIEAAGRAQAAEVVEAPGLDGIVRAYAFSSTPALSELGLTLAAGVPKTELVAGADDAMRRNLTLLALLAGAVFAFAWWAAEVSIRRPIASLAEASRRLRAGDLKTRVTGPHPGGEIGELVAGFNKTAAAIEAQNENLRRGNRALEMLSVCNQVLVRATSEPQLLDHVCALIVERGGYRFAWVGFAEPDQAGDVRLVAQAGITEDDLKRMRLTLSEAERAGDCTGTAIRTGHWCVARNIPTDPAPWREAATRYGYAASIALPLKFNGEVGGALNLYAADPETFDQQEIALLEQLADDIAYGIHTLRSQAARSKAEEALGASETRYRGLFEAAKDGILILDAETGAIVDMNPFLIELLGYSHEMFLQKKFCELGFFHDIVANQANFAQLQDKEYIRHENKALQTADGRRIEVEFVSNVYRVNDRKLIQCNIRDITERKRTNALLQLQATALNAAANAIIITDRDGTIDWANPAFYALTGYSDEEVVGRNPRFLKSGVHDAEFYRQLYETILAGSVWRGEMVNRYKDGRLGAEEVTITPLRGDDGAITHFIAIKVDITDRKRAEQEIRDVNASLERRVAERTLQLEEANRAKSDFLANMSHELRTPLNAIIGFSEMLKDGVLGKLEAKQRGFVADIFGAGTHLLSLINDILDLSKVEAGKLQLETDAVDVSALLQTSTMIVREKASAHRIRLDTRIDPGLGRMLADERKVKQIVYNLLSNAIKFTPEGGAVTLGACRCARAEVALDEDMPGRLLPLPPGEDGEFLAISVEDSGVGIAEEDLAKLFEPFVQVDASSARRQAGTGLGLSLVRRLAELHGGTVGVTSRPGAGSRFCVWLPYREATAAAQEDRAATVASASSEPGAAVPSTHAGAILQKSDFSHGELLAELRRAIAPRKPD